MKRKWMTQQQPFNFMPLKAGLGIITESELREYQDTMNNHPLTAIGYLCPKIYTTRTRRMSGEYQIVKGSRFKAKPIDPPIQFKVEKSYEIDFRTNHILIDGKAVHASYLDDSGYSFSELDLGIKGQSIETLHDILLKFNKRSTIDTKYYVNKLEPIDR